MDKISVAEARREDAVGRQVKLQGWVRTRRDSKGGFSFLELNDGSCQGNLQVVADGKLPNYESEIKKLGIGASVSVLGEIKKSPAKGQATELHASSVTVLGLAFALFVNQGWPLSTIARTILFTPNVVSATVIGLVWVWVLDTQYGVVNHYLGFLGIPQIPWLTSVHWSLIGVSIASIWWDMGLAFILFLAALHGRAHA